MQGRAVTANKEAWCRIPHDNEHLPRSPLLRVPNGASVPRDIRASKTLSDFQKMCNKHATLLLNEDVLSIEISMKLV